MELFVADGVLARAVVGLHLDGPQPGAEVAVTEWLTVANCLAAFLHR
jgi:hypothetical protein